MKNTIFTIMIIPATLSVFAGGVPAAEGGVGSPHLRVEAGNKAPEFTPTNYDGRTVSLSDYKGEIVVLEWFNYECPFVKYHYETAKTMIELSRNGIGIMFLQK